jgi:hypothetical protein
MIIIIIVTPCHITCLLYDQGLKEVSNYRSREPSGGGGGGRRGNRKMSLSSGKLCLTTRYSVE